MSTRRSPAKHMEPQDTSANQDGFAACGRLCRHRPAGLRLAASGGRRRLGDGVAWCQPLPGFFVGGKRAE